ncbi:hypothetical protein CEXT_285601 [Caerostris extrusa]|uniref:Very-long-chain 3-oxoacyl-CoA synthase n=1 Tax=Caerostris extrusa TaxID=172846 RepID=A0AAV4Y4D2_CAEEX|nr:hypothetical protein CEXT_285601 [Caerostris extrusa]
MNYSQNTSNSRLQFCDPTHQESTTHSIILKGRKLSKGSNDIAVAVVHIIYTTQSGHLQLKPFFCWTTYIIMVLWYLFDPVYAEEVNFHLQSVLFIFAESNSCMHALFYGNYVIKYKKNNQKIG